VEIRATVVDCVTRSQTHWTHLPGDSRRRGGRDLSGLGAERGVLSRRATAATGPRSTTCRRRAERPLR